MNLWIRMTDGISGIRIVFCRSAGLLQSPYVFIFLCSYEKDMENVCTQTALEIV